MKNAVLTKEWEELIWNKLAWKMNVWWVEIDVANYVKKVDEFLKSPWLFKTQANYERFQILSDMMKWISNWELQIYGLSEESRNLYNKISPYMSMVQSDKQSLMLHEFWNIAILDNIISSYKKWGTISHTKLKQFLNSMIEWWGNRIVWSLASDIKQDLLCSIDQIDDLTGFLKTNKIVSTTDKEEIVSQLFERRFKQFVFGKKWDIWEKTKDLAINEKIDRLVKQFMNTSEESTQYINSTTTEEW
jgi:hypothetical protein